jgi:hypothetical protein
MAVSRPGRRDKTPDEYDSVLTALAIPEPTGEEDEEAALGVYVMFPGSEAERIRGEPQLTLSRDAPAERGAADMLVDGDENVDADDDFFARQTLFSAPIVEPDFLGRTGDEDGFGVLGKMRDDGMVIDPLDAPKSMWGGLRRGRSLKRTAVIPGMNCARG